jgi:hypothetical protein
VSPVRYELKFYIPEDDILHSHRLATRRGRTVWCDQYTHVPVLSAKAGHGFAEVSTLQHNAEARAEHSLGGPRTL